MTQRRYCHRWWWMTSVLRGCLVIFQLSIFETQYFNCILRILWRQALSKAKSRRSSSQIILTMPLFGCIRQNWQNTAIEKSKFYAKGKTFNRQILFILVKAPISWCLRDVTSFFNEPMCSIMLPMYLNLTPCSSSSTPRLVWSGEFNVR